VTRPESPEERIEFVRRAIDAFNRRDADAMRSLASDDFEYDWTRSMGPNRGVYKGPDGFFEFISDQWEMFHTFELEADEFITRGNHVVVPTTIHGRGPQDVAVSAKSTHVYTFDGPRLVRITMFQTRDEALAATGGD
jgi:ketosteroid isomerase-like protein